MKRLYKVIIHVLFLVIAAYLYVSVVLFWGNRWKTYFLRSGHLVYYVYLTIFTYLYVQIMKWLWKVQVRLLSGL